LRNFLDDAEECCVTKCDLTFKELVLPRFPHKSVWV
jgi:hypothetical protein